MTMKQFNYVMKDRMGENDKCEEELKILQNTGHCKCKDFWGD